MKVRGIYETPRRYHLARSASGYRIHHYGSGAAHLKDELMPRYAKLVYNGYWWSPERKALQALIDDSQENVNGKVRLKLYKGNVIVVGRESAADSLYDADIVTFEDDAGAYDQSDAGGFIKLNALRLKLASKLGRKLT